MLERLLVLKDFCSEMSGEHSELRLTEQQWEKLQTIVEVTWVFYFSLAKLTSLICLGPKTCLQSNNHSSEGTVDFRRCVQSVVAMQT
jgi:hypothetical protein